MSKVTVCMWFLILLLLGLTVPSESSTRCYKCGPSTYDNISECSGNYVGACTHTDIWDLATDAGIEIGMKKRVTRSVGVPSPSEFPCIKITFKSGKVFKNCGIAGFKETSCRKDKLGYKYCSCLGELCNRGERRWSVIGSFNVLVSAAAVVVLWII